MDNYKYTVLYIHREFKMRVSAVCFRKPQIYELEPEALRTKHHKRLINYIQACVVDFCFDCLNDYTSMSGKFTTSKNKFLATNITLKEIPTSLTSYHVISDVGR